MCGIAGLYTKTEGLQARLGLELAKMLAQLSDRGPDSAGVAFYRRPVPPGATKVSLHAAAPGYDWEALAARLGGDVAFEVRASHAVFALAAEAGDAVELVRAVAPELTVMSAGEVIEIYKDTGPPTEFVERFALAGMDGTHALGHTRMATESRVTTAGSHPFSTGADLCLVHNGSLSNHNTVRRDLVRQGVEFRTECDSEVAAGYLTWRLAQGATLEQALYGCLDDLDGFFTFAVGTSGGFAVLRDPIACKPAVMAETDDWVAIASEYRAIAGLPGAEDADTWEPEPGRVYSWGQALVA